MPKDIHWLRLTEADKKNAGTIFQVKLYQSDGGAPRTLRFRRLRATGRERRLTADPLHLTADQWQQFIDRGHGFHATSMVTIARAHLGLYIAAVERDHQMFNDADLEGLRKSHPITYQKYLMIRQAQVELAKLYEAECRVDPNDVVAREFFKTQVLKLLIDLRAIGAGISNGHRSGVGRFDKMVYAAQDAVGKFQWPFNDGDSTETTLRKLTAADQLRPVGRHFIYVPGMDRSGASALTGKGFSSEQRDNLALCFARVASAGVSSKRKLCAEVRALLPNEGVVRFKPKLWQRSDLKRWKVQRRPYAAHSQGVVNTHRDEVMEAKARLAAQRWLVNVDFVPCFSAKEARDNAAVGLTLVVQEPNGGVIDAAQYGYAGNVSRHKFLALTLFYKLSQLPSEEYATLLKRVGGPESVDSLLSPFHSLEEVELQREMVVEQQRLVERFQQRWQIQLAQLIKQEVDAARGGRDAALLTREEVTACINEALKRGQAELRQLQAELRASLQAYGPRMLMPQGLPAPNFLRANLAGSLTGIIGAIAGVVEGMGLRDPIYGSLALATMVVGSAFSLAVAAHGGTVAAAKASSGFVSALAKAKVFTLFYQGVMPVAKGAKPFHAMFASIVNGFVMTKAQYILCSATDAMRGNPSFTGSLIGAMVDAPIEAAIVIGLAYGMGHLVALPTHEAAALGKWKFFDEMTGSLKPMAITFDTVFSAYSSYHYRTVRRGVVNAECFVEANQRLAELFARAIHAALLDEAVVTASAIAAHCQSRLAELLQTPGEPIIDVENLLEGFEPADCYDAVFDAANKVWQGEIAEAKEMKAVAAASADLRADCRQVYKQGMSEKDYLDKVTSLRAGHEAVAGMGLIGAARADAAVTLGEQSQLVVADKVQLTVELAQALGGVAGRSKFGRRLRTALQLAGHSGTLSTLRQLYAKQSRQFGVGSSMNRVDACVAELAYLQRLFYRDMVREREQSSGFWRALVEEREPRALKALTALTGGFDTDDIARAQVAPVSRSHVFGRSLLMGVPRLVRGCTSGLLVTAFVRPVTSVAATPRVHAACCDYSGSDDLVGFGGGVVRLAARGLSIGGTSLYVVAHASMRTAGRVSGLFSQRAAVACANGEARVLKTGIAVGRAINSHVEAAVTLGSNQVTFGRASHALPAVVMPRGKAGFSSVITILSLKSLYADYVASQKRFARDSNVMKGVKAVSKGRFSGECSLLQVLATIFPREDDQLQVVLARRKDLNDIERQMHRVASLQYLLVAELKGSADNKGGLTLKAFQKHEALLGLMTGLDGESLQALANYKQGDDELSALRTEGGHQLRTLRGRLQKRGGLLDDGSVPQVCSRSVYAQGAAAVEARHEQLLAKGGSYVNSMSMIVAGADPVLSVVTEVDDGVDPAAGAAAGALLPEEAADWYYIDADALVAQLEAAAFDDTTEAQAADDMANIGMVI